MVVVYVLTAGIFGALACFALLSGALLLYVHSSVPETAGKTLEVGGPSDSGGGSCSCGGSESNSSNRRKRRSSYKSTTVD